MAKSRIIIADTDTSYLIPLQLKFTESFFEKIDLELITQQDYFNILFASPQKADILIVSEDLYTSSLSRHNIAHTFIMTENRDEGTTGALNAQRIFKYTSTKEIFNEIIRKASDVLELSVKTKKGCQIIAVYSACGGTGKTTLALGLCVCLEKQFRRVLYINAVPLQTFSSKFENKSPIAPPEVYASLEAGGRGAYRFVTHVVRKEGFGYLPRFKAALMSLGLKFSVFENIALGAKESGDYDYIVIDMDSVFDEDRARLLSLADKVVITLGQSASSLYATNILVSNISDSRSDKYIYICNDFNQYEKNFLITRDVNSSFIVSDYVEHFDDHEQMSIDDLAQKASIQRITFLIM